jgi:hypothetical protein
MNKLLLTALLVLATSAQARDRHQAIAFKRSHPCPATGLPYGSCKGWVIDHIDPLACGGADDPSNMQWQTKAEAKAKDKWERKGCYKGKRKGQ